MIIKLQKIIHCSSEHPDFPVSNLLKIPSPGPWKCAKPGELMATVIFQLPESTCIIGLDIGNYRSCIVIVTGSTTAEPDNWTPIVNHQFMTHDEAINNKFKDQVQLFTKNELNSDTLKIKFDRIKVSCMQSANHRELFGLSSFILRTEVAIDLNINVFGRFQLKNDETEKSKSEFKDRYLRLFPEKQKSFKENMVEKIKEAAVDKFNKRQEEERTPKKRPLLEKLEAGKADEVFGKKASDDEVSNSSNGKENSVKRTPFGDVVQSPSGSKKKIIESKTKPSVQEKNINDEQNSAQASTSTTQQKLKKEDEKVNGTKTPLDAKCLTCLKDRQGKLCPVCKKLPPIHPIKSPLVKKRKVSKSHKPFPQLLADVVFSLSGYVNPQRDDIRQKAIKMGGKYNNNPNTTDNKCTHLICAFPNTPKLQQLKGHAKIVSHKFITDCFQQKKRFPWRRYAVIPNDSKQPESEEEIESDPYQQDTESDDDGDDY